MNDTELNINSFYIVLFIFILCSINFICSGTFVNYLVKFLLNQSI